MPKPKSKEELLELSQANLQKLLELIDSLNPKEKVANFPEGLSMQRNARDVLSHLHHWHLMLMDWYDIGMGGKKPEMPAPGYTWKTTSELNFKIRDMYENVSLDDMRIRFSESYQNVRKIILRHSQEELFTKKRYAWTGSTSLGAYLISATSSHYDWAIKVLKKYKKHLKAQSA